MNQTSRITIQAADNGFLLFQESYDKDLMVWRETKCEIFPNEVVLMDRVKEMVGE